jgi:assimilatory nitrate reductase catalytic subunit
MNAPFPRPEIKTTCPYCGVGCGVKAKPDGLGGAGIAGDEKHPANFGRLCSKGSALAETLSLEGRLLQPMRRMASGNYAAIRWHDAFDDIAESFQRISAQHGPESLAFYLSGQLLTEDYYVANKLAKGFLGTPHVDTNSRLCMASSVAGHRRAFGGDLVPGSYEDLDSADLVVLVGSNTAWCHPVLFQRMLKNRRERGAKLILIDPRRTATADDCDLFLPIRPGTDTVLFAHLLLEIEKGPARDVGFIERHTTGYVEALAKAKAIAPDLDSVACQTGLSADDIRTFVTLWLETQKTVTAWSQGVNQSAQGTDKVNAIINCHLATGRIGKPGLGPFSLTGQPNAMGGREVGGLANMLAAHMNYGTADRERVARFWNAPRLAEREGLKAVAMMDAIARQQIRALWVMATNPVASLPDTNRVRQALSGLDLFIVSDVVLRNDTIAAEPHLLLPATAWGEKDGTVTNSERRISRQRRFLPLPGEALPDWRIMAEVGKRLGFVEAFDWPNAAAVFREHAALTAFENGGERLFDIGGLAGLSDDAYDDFEPVQWPMRTGVKPQERLFADGRFATHDGKARFVAIDAINADRAAEGRFRLNTGRVRDHWHTLTRTGKSVRLSQHISEPCLAIHSDDAGRLGLAEGGLVEVNAATGTGIFKIALDPGQRPGEVFLPMHWSRDTSGSAASALVHAVVDPVSGQPDLKGSSVSLKPVRASLHGLLLTREPMTIEATYWARRIVDGGYLTVFSGDVVPDLPTDALIRLDDDAMGLTRRVAVRQGRVEAALFTAPIGTVIAADPILALFAVEEDARVTIKALIAGGAAGQPDKGPVICACFAVRRSSIDALIAEQPYCDVTMIGEKLQAGTNCGSCQPELRKLIKAAMPSNDARAALSA